MKLVTLTNSINDDIHVDLVVWAEDKDGRFTRHFSLEILEGQTIVVTDELLKAQRSVYNDKDVIFTSFCVIGACSKHFLENLREYGLIGNRPHETGNDIPFGQELIITPTSIISSNTWTQQAGCGAEAEAPRMRLAP